MQLHHTSTYTGQPSAKHRGSLVPHSLMAACRVVTYSVLTCAVVSIFPEAHAQIRLEEKDAEAVTVTVRTIEATLPIDNEVSTQASTSSQADIQQVDTALADLQSKLHEIPYQNFRLVSTKQERLCLKKKQSLQLPNGQSLSFRPLYMDGKKVGLWINWRDSDGAGILDTRLHFSSDESVITGTDHAPGTGTILAIKAEPISKTSGFMLR